MVSIAVQSEESWASINSIMVDSLVARWSVVDLWAIQEIDCAALKRRAHCKL